MKSEGCLETARYDIRGYNVIKPSHLESKLPTVPERPSGVCLHKKKWVRGEKHKGASKMEMMEK